MSTITPVRPGPVQRPAPARRPANPSSRNSGSAGRFAPFGRTGAGGPVRTPVPGARGPRVAGAAPRRSAARSGFVFVVLVLGLMVGALVAVLMLNTMIAQDAFVRTDLVKQQRVLHDEQQELRQQVAAEEAPQRLAARAAALGMVPTGGPMFIRLRDAKILGIAEAAKAPAPAVDLRVAVTARSTAKAKPRATSTTP